MSLEENKALISKVIEAVNGRNLTLLDELIASDFVYHTDTQQIQGLEVMKQVIEEEINGFPDLHVAIEDVIAEGHKVCIRLKETGTHTGKFRGLAPTGKKINYTAITIWRIVNSKVVEGWGVYDMLDFYKQLGVIEYKGFPDEAK
ncbi:MAG: ester cyclase [Candidatus Hermodarchaeota archaeon]|nr:ester cyclase [Candidatus Hermodarchaeota archaeon]